MVTKLRLEGRVVAYLAMTLAACSGRLETHGPGEPGNYGSSSGGSSGMSSSGSNVGAAQYPGHGFVVHEWGTDTIVVGSDGSLQRGLHHEEEDLPSFVYDRIKAAKEAGLGSPSVEVKMETPVTYFYSDKPLTVTASVDFPQGIFTQWYPGVGSFSPAVAGPNAGGLMVPVDFQDPALDVSFPFRTTTCRDHYTTIAQGHLDWGSIDVLARDAQPALLDAPLARYSWSYARNVAANPVQTQSGQVEQFLFYRGLGNFDVPARVTAASAGAVTLTNGYGDALGPVFVLNVGASNAAFKAHAEGLPAGAALHEVAPSLDGAPALDAYAQSLSDAITSALVSVGLYRDESTAMVSTWSRQWFRTQGLRLLYIASQSWTDASIPLTITPQPDSVTRVMMIRIEVLTPEIESADVQAAQGLSSQTTAAQSTAYFTALGRFAEPRLRRAMALLGNPPYAQTLLGQIATANTDVSSGE
jgi:hypothetical protein